MGEAPRPPLREDERAIEVTWTTITYRTIIFYAFLLVLGIGFVAYLIAPQFFTRNFKKAMAGISAGLFKAGQGDAATSKREAHFVNIDGTVRVKKSLSAQWIRADYNTALEKGDFVQTAGDSVARIIFADGTNYVLKPDSLIVVEENREDPVTRATRVAVQVTSGAVDLSTGRFEVPGSTAQIAFENAVATLGEESRAAVRNDPSKNVHEFTVASGQADVTRGATTVRLGQYEKVSFQAEQAGLIKEKVIAPPQLTSPANLTPIITETPKTYNINFAWTAVPGAASYHLKVSPSGMFTNMVLDRRFGSQTSYQTGGLEEGTYYWVVSSLDAKGVESQDSEANKFSLIRHSAAASQVFLNITQIIQHGKVLEILGRTEPGSSVIINNEQVFSIAPDGTFRHFTSPLPSTGAHQISITAQNRRGDVNTIRKTVVIE